MLALLTGFMAGSLPRLWPWHAGGKLLSPAGYEAATGLAALWPGAVTVAIAGVAGLWLLSRLE
jgi:hypothetical protein